MLVPYGNDNIKSIKFWKDRALPQLCAKKESPTLRAAAPRGAAVASLMPSKGGGKGQRGRVESLL